MTPRKLVLTAQRVILALRWAFRSPKYMVIAAGEEQPTYEREWYDSLEKADSLAWELSMGCGRGWPPARRINVFAIQIEPICSYFNGVAVSPKGPASGGSPSAAEVGSETAI